MSLEFVRLTNRNWKQEQHQGINNNRNDNNDNNKGIMCKNRDVSRKKRQTYRKVNLIFHPITHDNFPHTWHDVLCSAVSRSVVVSPCLIKAEHVSLMWLNCWTGRTMKVPCWWLLSLNVAIASIAVNTKAAIGCDNGVHSFRGLISSVTWEWLRGTVSMACLFIERTIWNINH